MVAQHIAPEQRGTAPDVGAKPIAPDRDLRRRDVIERQARAVLGRIELCRRRRQPECRIRDEPHHIPDRTIRGGQDCRADLGQGRLDRAAFEHRWVIDYVDVVAVPRIGTEDEPIGIRGHRECRACIGDPAHTDQQVGDLANLTLRKIRPVDVRDAVMVGQEIEARSVARPLRVDVLGVGNGCY